MRVSRKRVGIRIHWANPGYFTGTLEHLPKCQIIFGNRLLFWSSLWLATNIRIIHVYHCGQDEHLFLFYRTGDSPRRYRWWIQDQLLWSGRVLGVLRQNQSGYCPAPNMAARRCSGTIQTGRPKQLHRRLYVCLYIHLIIWIISISNSERISHLEWFLELNNICLQV